MEILFWLSVTFLAYAFAGYPLVLWLLSFVRKQSHRRAPIQPKISIIVPVHNAAELLQTKLVNTLALVYPEEKREIIVASDASVREVAEVVRSFADRGVKFVESSMRRGKHYVQMLARDISEGEILVFTDVSIHLEAGALERIISNFADPAIGCVSSVDEVATKKKGRMGEALYVGFEMWLRRLETRVGSLVGNSGSFFAARRELCESWQIEQSSDFFLALHAVAHGFRTVVDPECRGRYLLVGSETAELQRKVRTIVHGIDVLFTHRKLLNPLRYGVFSWQLISHKLFRWLVPFGLSSLLIANLYLWESGAFYQVTLAMQLIFYGIGMAALLANRFSRFRLFKVVGFFVMGNAATALAWFYFVVGEKFVTWQPSRRS